MSSQAAVFTQATGATQPSYVLSDPTYNGKPTLRFNGSQQMTSAVLTTPIVQPCTLVVVGHSAGTGAVQQGFVSGQGGSDLLVYWQNVYRVYAGAAINSTIGVAFPTVITGLMNGASSAVYINNSQPSNATGTVGSGSATQLTIGEYVAGAGFLTGTIAEIVLYNALLNSTALTALFQYFAARYNPGGWS